MILILIMIIGLPALMINLKTVRAESNFNDNFDDGVADGWTPQVGSWSVIEGQYCISVGIENGITTVNGLNLKDCAIETKLRFSDNVGFRAGVIFRYMGKDTYYSLEVSNEYDVLCFVKYLPEYAGFGMQGNAFVGTAPTEADFARGELTLGRKVIDSVPVATINKGVDYTLRVNITGNKFVGELISNGLYQRIMWEDTDNQFEYGAVGLRAQRADVSFDYFKVENGTNLPLTSPTVNPTPEPDLIAWWKLNEGSGTVAFDSSGNNYSGTIHGASWTNSQGKSFLNFNGMTDYVSIPSSELSNLDSCTVISWINSDLAKLGLIIYHGDVGEFHMGNGALEQDANWLNTNPTYANFGVKLSNFNWYGVSSSAPMQPNVWHQIAGVWSKGAFLKIYVDGVLAGENNFIPSLDLNNPGSSFPSSLGVVSQDRWNVPDFFKGQISNVMIFNRVLTTPEISDLFYSPLSIPRPAQPILDVSCKSSTSYSGFNVEIEGRLTLNETAITEAPILLSYSVNGGKSWQDLTMVTTASDGTFSAVWNPSVTGIYLIKAVYEADSDYYGATAVVTLSVTQYAEENVFSVTSNSTLSSLIFNSQTHELSFTVTGPEDTTGYVDVNIPNSLIANIANVKAYIDGDEIDYTSTSVDGFWHLHFIYQHSTHEVILSLGPPPSNLLFDNPVGYAIIIGSILVACVSLLLYFKKRKR